MKKQEVEEAWDKKKISITLLVVLGLIGCIVYFSGAYKIPTNNESVKKDAEVQLKKSVEGAADAVGVSDVKEVVQQKIEEIKTEAKTIDVIEIASSSPQVQKIINDIKALESYPADQAKTMCEKICDSF